jgi:hypothetical protein
VDAVALLRAEAGSSPSGTGSFSFFANFSILVENLAFAKEVQILAREKDSGSWTFFPAAYSSSVPENGEIWTAHLGDPPVDQFVVQYQVLGATFWDNNSGFNYVLDAVAAEEIDGIGTALLTSNVQSVGFDLDAGGNLAIDILVTNLAYVKQVAVVYTTDNWATFHNVFGAWQQSYPPFGLAHQINAELWTVSASVGAGKHGQFAVFYDVSGSRFWDNNFGRNYSF